jgi:hypothetical protein
MRACVEENAFAAEFEEIAVGADFDGAREIGETDSAHE